MIPEAPVARTPGMDLTGKRILVAGAAGALGGDLSSALADAGADVVTAGRHDCDVSLDLADPASPAAAVAAAGRLDAIVLATGNVAFGAAEETPDEIVRALFDVNVVGPVALIRAALAAPEPPQAIVALSAIVADLPTAHMAAYSAAKAALSAYLTALRHERRKARTTVLDVRPPHLDTGFETRALAGRPPRLPEPVPATELVPRVVDALREGRRVLRWDAGNRQFVTA
ncbi:MAG TPA: SDR family NAD(P)-dependent oxidoreductase [Solirubrobacteraceae bacterium]|nr:SDR family NAD(P)-dependent oxidoreductase [Solirubrobacteraceae bacterium]